MKILNSLLFWVVRSSKDSTKWSLTVKSGLVSVLAFLAYAHINTGNLPSMVDTIVSLVEQTLMWVSTTVALYGAYRKVIRTLQGKNDVVNSPVWHD